MTIKRRYRGLLCAGLSVFLALAGGEVLADGKSEGRGHGKSHNLGHDSAADGIKAEIKANHEIFYSGDPLLISIKFPRGAELITSGEVDAHLLIFKPDADTVVLPVSNIASEESHKLFDIMGVDIEKLPEGVYQFGVVLTVPDGDPLVVDDWYNGLRGLIAMRGLTVSGEPLEVDADGDGDVDCDADGDGFVDEGSTCVDDSEDDTSGDDTTGDDTTGDDTTGDDTTGDDTTGDDTTGDDTTGDDTTGGAV